MNLRPEHVNTHALVDNFSIPPGRQVASDLVWTPSLRVGSGVQTTSDLES